MSEQKDFSYEGNVVIKVTKESPYSLNIPQSDFDFDSFEVLDLVNIMPVEIVVDLGKSIRAEFDYAKKRLANITSPEWLGRPLSTQEKSKIEKKAIEFLDRRESQAIAEYNRQKREYEIMSKKVNIPSPTEEDDD